MKSQGAFGGRKRAVAPCVSRAETDLDAVAILVQRVGDAVQRAQRHPLGPAANQLRQPRLHEGLLQPQSSRMLNPDVLGLHAARSSRRSVVQGRRTGGFAHRMRATPWQLSRREHTPPPLKG